MNELAEICQQLFTLFALLNLAVPSEDTDLFETGLLDSLTFVELLVRVEEQMGVTVTLENLEPDNFRSIRRIASFVLASKQLRTAS